MFEPHVSFAYFFDMCRLTSFICVFFLFFKFSTRSASHFPSATLRKVRQVNVNASAGTREIMNVIMNVISLEQKKLQFGNLNPRIHTSICVPIKTNTKIIMETQTLRVLCIIVTNRVRSTGPPGAGAFWASDATLFSAAASETVRFGLILQREHQKPQPL